MHQNESSGNHYGNLDYYKHHIKEIIGMLRMMQDSCIGDIDRFDDEMSVVMRHIRHTAVTLLNEEICRIDNFADGLNALKQEEFVDTVEIEIDFLPLRVLQTMKHAEWVCIKSNDYIIMDFLFYF